MEINPETKVFGVTGFPLGHSLSPLMHNDAFRFTGMDAIYLYFPSRDIRGVIEGMKALAIQGMSVTIPHKEQACDYVDSLDPLAYRIGALNTLVNLDGHITGYNTDAYGATEALKTRVKDLKDKRVLIIGAGGAARAIGFALLEEGCRLMVANRTESKGKALAKDMGAEFCPLHDLPPRWADIMIQATSVGMYPNTEATIVPEDLFNSNMVVMDIVYNPLETLFIRNARKKGCKTVPGIEMFVRQGAKQFSLWTGQEAPFDRMMKTVKEYLDERNKTSR